jgi:hypothetical protein
MERYVGLDVSLKQASICVVNQTGLVMREGVVDSDPEAGAACDVVGIRRGAISSISRVASHAARSIG